MSLRTNVRALRGAAVASALLLGLSACSSDDTSSDEVETSSAAATNDAEDTTAAAPSTLDVMGTGSLKWEPTALSAAAGEVTFSLTSEVVVHNIVIEGVNGDEPVVEAQPGETQSGTVTLEAGTYTFFCAVPGHREAGMEGQLTVA